MLKVPDPTNRSRLAALAAACLLVLASLPADALVNAQAPPADDKRFDAVAAFSHARWLGLDPDHDNARDHNWYGNATLIAPDVVLLSKHLVKGNAAPPAGEYAVRFRRKPDGSLGSKKKDADSFHNVKILRFVTAANTDLALGILEKPVEHIDPMPLGLDDQALNRDAIQLAAWGSQSRFRGVGGPRDELRVGKTIAIRPPGAPVVRFPAGEVETRDWRENKETGEMERKPYVTSDYPVVNMYDSGGAILQEDDQGNPRLIGVIATYGGGAVIAPADTDAFPLSKAAEEGAAALGGLPFAPQ